MIRRMNSRPYLLKRKADIERMLTLDWVRGLFRTELLEELHVVNTKLKTLTSRQLTRRASKLTRQRRRSQLKRMR